MHERHHSYGIIPLHKTDRGIEVLVVRQAQLEGEYWSFPKGTPEANETPIETARREVMEEVGITFGDVEEKMFSEDYTFKRDGKIIEKTTTYFIGFADTTEFTLQEEEIAEAKWMLIGDVEQQLTFPETKRVFKQVCEHLGQ